MWGVQVTTPPSLTSCCQVTAYADPVCVVGGKPSKIRIGDVARCGKCHKLKSDFRADRNVGPDILALQRKMTGSSWAMLTDRLIKLHDIPPYFEMGSVGLVPVGYKGEVKDQPEFDEEAPF